jgi:hypothetical protein
LRPTPRLRRGQGAEPLRAAERRAGFERGRQQELAEAGEPDEFLGPSILARLAAEDVDTEEAQEG